MPWQERSTSTWHTSKATPSCCQGPDPYSTGLGDPNLWAGILIVFAGFYGVYRWTRYATARTEKRRQERIEKLGR